VSSGETRKGGATVCGMTGTEDSLLLDQIYNSALERELWQPVMARLADMVGGVNVWRSQLNLIDGTGGKADLMRLMLRSAGLNPA